MSDQKRTTVTTIETQEIWIIRRAVPELLESDVLSPEEITQASPVIPLTEANRDSETTNQLKKVQTEGGKS